MERKVIEKIDANNNNQIVVRRVACPGDNTAMRPV